MSRLTAELARLYPAASAAGVQTLVLQLAGPASWDTLGPLWRGVQADLALPAPAIAVSGTDGLQLWFSLQQPVPAAEADAFLAALCRRYLADVAPARLRAQPALNSQPWAAPAVPALQADGENWSAFVAQDLAPIFADTPWLDVAPSADGQADLLARLSPVTPAAWQAAQQALGLALGLTLGLTDSTAEPAPASGTAAPPAPAAAAPLDPRAFLQSVLDDESAPLALRVEAAKTLLQHP